MISRNMNRWSEVHSSAMKDLRGRSLKVQWRVDIFAIIPNTSPAKPAKLSLLLSHWKLLKNSSKGDAKDTKSFAHHVTVRWEMDSVWLYVADSKGLLHFILIVCGNPLPAIFTMS